MNFLAVDPGLTSPAFHVFDFYTREIVDTPVLEMQATGFDRYVEVDEFVRHVLVTHECICLVIEGYGVSRFNPIPMVSIGHTIRFSAAVIGVPFIEIPPTSLKKFVTGSGKGSKKEKIMLEVYKRWGYEGTNDECDAFAVAMFFLAMFHEMDMPKVNLDALPAVTISNERALLLVNEMI